MKLAPLESQSALWLKLKEHFEQRLAVLRASNDFDMPDNLTWKLRGQIAGIKELLELGEPDPAPLVEHGDE